jgi:SAM-dependent methyltransferase
MTHHGLRREPISFSNVYSDQERAEAYATLEFPGTYWLAFRDLPEIIEAHISGKRALDFGCGAGRSARFLKSLGFETTGIDISPSMLEQARAADPDGMYVADFSELGEKAFDLILAAFPFDNIPGAGYRASLLRELGQRLSDSGRIILLGSTAEIYWHEWVSFTTEAFPENRDAKSGETVHIIMKDVADSRPVVDVIWFAEDYEQLFEAAGLELVAHYHPLGRDSDPFDWMSETSVAPWFVYVLK